MATLKISDLSVGDWVRCRGRNGRIERLEVIRYDERIRVAVESDLGTMYQFVGIEDIDPIPITPGKLEANGFVKNGGVYLWSNKKHRVFVGLKEFSHFVDIEEMDKQFDTKSSRIEVSQLYAHQLQHALRLVGVDKEINLKLT